MSQSEILTKRKSLLLTPVLPLYTGLARPDEPAKFIKELLAKSTRRLPIDDINFAHERK